MPHSFFILITKQHRKVQRRRAITCLGVISAPLVISNSALPFGHTSSQNAKVSGAAILGIYICLLANSSFDTSTWPLAAAPCKGVLLNMSLALTSALWPEATPQFPRGHNSPPSPMVFHPCCSWHRPQPCSPEAIPPRPCDQQPQQDAAANHHIDPCWKTKSGLSLSSTLTFSQVATPGRDVNFTTEGEAAPN